MDQIFIKYVFPFFRILLTKKKIIEKFCVDKKIITI